MRWACYSRTVMSAYGVCPEQYLKHHLRIGFGALQHMTLRTSRVNVYAPLLSLHIKVSRCAASGIHPGCFGIFTDDLMLVIAVPPAKRVDCRHDYTR